jgi:hypothetical protein
MAGEFFTLYSRLPKASLRVLLSVLPQTLVLLSKAKARNGQVFQFNPERDAVNKIIIIELPILEVGSMT